MGNLNFLQENGEEVFTDNGMHNWNEFLDYIFSNFNNFDFVAKEQAWNNIPGRAVCWEKINSGSATKINSGSDAYNLKD